MKKISFFIVLQLSFVINLYAQTEYTEGIDCYTIVAGKNATVDNCVYVAHNEDDWGNLIVNIYKVPKLQHKTEYLTLVSGEKIPQVPQTYGYIWFETTKQNFGDSFINDYGVTICSNACSSKEDTASGILTYDLRKLVIERSKSAREAVKVLGNLVETYGYNSSGRSYCIGDAHEVWFVQVVKGRRWAAQRVPDEHVAIVPNYYTIGEMDLSDTLNFMASPDLVDYAIQRGWYDPESGKRFNFRQAYSTTLNLYAIWNLPRHWAGYNMLSGKTHGYHDNFPFSFKPAKKVSIDDITRVLSSHYEGTDFETNKELHRNPHRNMVNRICNAGTKFSFVAQLKSDIPENNANVIWFAPMNPCMHPYIPIAYSIKKFPEVYHKGRSYDKALKTHFDEEKNKFEVNKGHAYEVFNTITKKTDADYWNLSEKQHSFKQEFEQKAKQKFNKKPTGKTSYKLLEELYNQEKNIK